MTDYGKPTTPGDACRIASEDLRQRSAMARREAEKHLTIADTLMNAAGAVEGGARRWDQYQPKQAAETAPAVVDREARRNAIDRAAEVMARAMWDVHVEEVQSRVVEDGDVAMDAWGDLPLTVRKSRAREQEPAARALADAGLLAI